MVSDPSACRCCNRKSRLYTDRYFCSCSWAFFVLAFLIALMNVIRANAEKEGQTYRTGYRMSCRRLQSLVVWDACSGKSNVSVAKAETKTEAKDKE